VFKHAVSFHAAREAVFSPAIAGHVRSVRATRVERAQPRQFFLHFAYYVTPDAAGWFRMQFSIVVRNAAVIQALSSNTWNDVAVVTPDSNKCLLVLYPACLVGPSRRSEVAR